MVEAEEQYVKELESLDKGDTTEESPVEEESSKIREKDGDLYILDSEGAESSPEGEILEEDKPTEEGEEVSYKGTPYEGKSVGEVVEMHRNAEKKITEQGHELGEFRKSESEITEEEAYERLTGDDIEVFLAEEKKNLSELDPYDNDSHNEQLELISQLESDLIRKRTQEAIAERYNSRDNEKFIQEQKQKLTSEGFDLKDEEFDRVLDGAKYYREDGLLTDRSFHKGLIDEFGVGRVTKFLTMEGEKKAREDIQKASAKTSEKVDVRGSGKGAKFVKVDEMGRKELRKNLKGLSPDELKRLYARRNQ